VKAAELERARDGALTEAQARNPDWGVWISSAGRYWASRRGNIRHAERVSPRWAMTVDADSLAELEKRIKEQEGYGIQPARAPDPASCPR